MGVEACEECIAQGQPQAHKGSRQGVRERMGGEQHGCGRRSVKGKRGFLGKRHIVNCDSFPDLPPFPYFSDIPKS